MFTLNVTTVNDGVLGIKFNLEVDLPTIHDIIKVSKLCPDTCHFWQSDNFTCHVIYHN